MSMTSLDGIKSGLAGMLQGIECYNPDNIATLERYVDCQLKEIGYDLEANLALLKLYQFNPGMQNTPYVCKILLKALMNLPHSDFIVCKCLLSQEVLDDPTIQNIEYLHNLMETCRFKEFWAKVHAIPEVVRPVAGFEDSIRKFVCHVVGITYQHIREEMLYELLGLVNEDAVNQWINKNGWKVTETGYVLISNQEENIKTKKITEKIDLEAVTGIMASSF